MFTRYILVASHMNLNMESEKLYWYDNIDSPPLSMLFPTLLAFFIGHSRWFSSSIYHDPLIFIYQKILRLEFPQLKTLTIKFLGLYLSTARHLLSPPKSIPQISHWTESTTGPIRTTQQQRCPLEAKTTPIPNFGFNPYINYLHTNSKTQKINNVRA